MSILKHKSIQHGLIIPESEACKSYEVCSKEPASLHELELAAKPHRWKEFRKLQKDFFNVFMDKVEYYETEILKILGLPSLNTVRDSFKQTSDSWDYTAEQIEDVEELMGEWTTSLTGNSSFDTDSVYNYYQLTAFSIGLSRAYNSIRQRAETEYLDYIAANQVIGAMDNPYLQAIVTDGGKRIKDALGKKWWDKVLPQLQRMAREGRSPIEVARWMHRNAMFEGQAWYWLRLARTESVLALNAAFDAQCRKLGVQYEEWSAGGNACYICSAFDGKIWRIREGPLPAADTHPHCLCVRVPLFTVNNSPIQDTWTRESPYIQPYSVDEVDNLIQNFRY